MSKHTKGPWICEHGTADHYHICEQATRLNIATTCDRLALRTSAAAQSMEEDEANARLIAAAPDLLAALEQILADWDSVPGWMPVPDEINDNGHWDAVRAAISKAKGE